MKLKRFGPILLLLLLVLATPAALAACGGDDTVSSGAVDSSVPSDPTASSDPAESESDAPSHSFTAEVIEDAYLASPATCTEPARYYYACADCGEAGSETFPHGEALGHDYVGGFCSRCLGEEPYAETLAFRSNGDGTCFVAGIGAHSGKTVRIPPTSPDGETVTGISELAFENQDALIEIIVPDSVTSIGPGAFRGCSALRRITLPFVGAKAGMSETDPYQYPFGYIFGIDEDNDWTSTKQYYYGRSTSSITSSSFFIPDSLESVRVTGGDLPLGAFSNCTCLTSVSVDAGAARVGGYAFLNCESLTSVSIPDGVTRVGERAFYGCTALLQVTIPVGVTEICERTFYGCGNLVGVTIPDGMKTIGEYAFYQCGALIGISLPDGVETIGENAFYECRSLSRVTLPDSLSTIGHGAFYACSSLGTVALPSGITEIAESTFMNCSSLTEATIPAGVTSIGYQAFYGCRSLATLDFGGSTDDWNAIQKGTAWNQHFHSSHGLTELTFTVRCENGVVSYPTAEGQ